MRRAAGAAPLYAAVVPGPAHRPEALLRLLRGAGLPVCSLDWVELNPTLDPTGASTEIAAALLAVALGEDPL